MTCQHCDAIEKGEIIEENEYAVVFLSPKPSAEGHIIVAPKRHVAILEQLEDYEVAKMTSLANKFSIIAFEKLQSQGTNILIQNGISAGQLIPHVAMHILPRKENDNVSLQWNPKQIGEEDLASIENILKEECKSIGKFDLEPKKKEEKKEEIKAQKVMKGEENYMIKSLRRIP